MNSTGKLYYSSLNAYAHYVHYILSFLIFMYTVLLTFTHFAFFFFPPSLSFSHLLFSPISKYYGSVVPHLLYNDHDSLQSLIKCDNIIERRPH